MTNHYSYTLLFQIQQASIFDILFCLLLDYEESSDKECISIRHKCQYCKRNELLYHQF